MFLTYSYRLYPSARQYRALDRVLDLQRDLYNAALQNRRDAWEWAKKNSPEKFEEAKKQVRRETSYMGQMGQGKQLTAIRNSIPEYGELPSRLSRGTLQRLDNAFQAFFRRVKAGEKPGYPRFKGKNWFRTLEFSEFSGIRIKGGRLYFKGVPGGLRIRLHRPLPGKPKTAKLTRDHRGWRAAFQVEVEAAGIAVKRKPAIGVDAGIKALAACSDGVFYEPSRAAYQAEREARRRGRALSRTKRGSKGRRKRIVELQRVRAREANARNDRLHKVATAIVGRAGAVAVEELNVKGMMASGGARKRGLNRALADAAMGRLHLLLEYKAERAGVQFQKVNARNTSQECSECGANAPKGLEVRVHQCAQCGLELDRDVNAARNILKRAKWGRSRPQAS